MRAIYHHLFKKEQCRIGKSLAYRLHFHHQIELVYMFKGKCTAIIDGREYDLLPGDILTVFPNQLHEYKTGEGEEFFITIFKPETLPEFKDIFYNMLPESNVYSSSGEDSFLREIAERLPDIYNSDLPYKEQIYKGLLSAFFGDLLSKYVLSKTREADLSVLKSTLAYFNENYLEEISLETVAKQLHVSKYYISHLLNDKLNVSFNEYINSLRVANAVNLMDEGVTDISELAQKSGFNTVRTFNRAFKNVYGISPSQYKKTNAASK